MHWTMDWLQIASVFCALCALRDADEPTLYAVEFIYDADVESVVTIFLQAREIYRDGVLR